MKDRRKIESVLWCRNLAFFASLCARARVPQQTAISLLQLRHLIHPFTALIVFGTYMCCSPCSGSVTSQGCVAAVEVASNKPMATRGLAESVTRVNFATETPRILRLDTCDVAFVDESQAKVQPYTASLYPDGATVKSVSLISGTLIEVAAATDEPN